MAKILEEVSQIPGKSFQAFLASSVPGCCEVGGPY